MEKMEEKYPVLFAIDLAMPQVSYEAAVFL
jgi:hypothetical protein